MAESGLVSVIIPFYNRISLVCRAIDSVTSQTYMNYEIILVDDGSTDDITPLLKKIQNISNTLLLKQKNQGPSSARNKGIDNSKGEYIAFLDSDDVWSVDKLSVQIDFMIKNGFLFSHTSYFRKTNQPKKKCTIKSGMINYKYPFIIFHCKIATPTVIIHESLLSSGNRFNEDVLVGEDTIFWIRLSKITVLYGMKDILSTVYIDEHNTANNFKLKISAFKSINASLKSNILLMMFHRLYINIRIYLKIL